MVIPGILKPIIFINPLTYTTAAFRYIVLQMDTLPQQALLKAGVAFDVYGFVITPVMGIGLVFVMGIAFFMLCVNQFGKTDFSRIKILKGGHGHG
jgi:ABC-2 type transport system permease protein